MGRDAKELENRLPSLAWTFEYDLMVDCPQSLVFLVAPVSLKILLQKRYELIVACLLLFGVMGFMFILALDLVPYSQSFVVPLGIDQSIMQILSIKPFFISRAMVPGLDAAAKLPDSSAMTSCIDLTYQDTDLIKPYKPIELYILAVT